MPIVNVDLAQFSGETTGLEPDNGSVWFWPYRPYIEDESLVSREILKVRTEDGVAAPVLPETPLTEAVWVQLRGVKGAGTPWLVQIPATEVNLFDLDHIDPDTLDPEAPPSPAWLAALEAVEEDVTAAQADADAADAKAVAAQADADAAQTDATNALAGLATKVNAATLDGDDLTLYGGSFTDLASGAASGLDPEEMYFNIFADEYDGGTVTTYGKSGTRIDYTLASLLSTGTWPGLPAPVAGALWPGTSNRLGDVIVDCGTNDNGHYGVDGVTPVAIEGSGGDNYMEGIAAMHEAVIALASTETRIELGVSGGTPGAGNTFTGAGWSIGQAAAYMSGGAFSATSNEGDKVSRSITPPQVGPHAGRVFVVTLLFDTALALNADVDRVVDGRTASRWTAVKWESYGSVNVAVAVIPVDLPIDGAAHTVELIHAGTTGQYFSPDVVLIPSEAPGDIYFMQAPDPVPATLWDAAEVAIWKANRTLLEPEVRTAIGLHANALWGPCKSMTPGGYWTDGIHPGLVGMIQRAADLGAAFSLRKLVGSIYKAMVT